MDYLAEFKRFLEAEKRLEGNSIDAYMNDVGGFLNWATPTGREFSGTIAEEYLKSMEHLGRKPSFRRHVRVAIRRFYHWLAVHKKLMSLDEIEKIDPIRNEWHNLPTLTYKEVLMLLDACEGEAAERNRTIILLMFYTGMRVSEVCDLNLNSLLPSMKALRVTVKGRVDRVIPVTGECFAALQDYAGRWRTRHAVNTPALFVNKRSSNGQRMKRRRVSNVIAGLAAKVGLVKSSAHTLRRSRATQLLDNGIAAEEVRDMLGHYSVKITERYFTTSPEKVRAAYNVCFRPVSSGPESA